MPPVNVLLKPASSMCNMKCEYCFYCDEAKNRQMESYGFMTEETLKNVIRKTICKAEGYVSFAYQGGEATLRGLDFFKRAVELQKQYNKNNVKVYNALQTNGILLNQEWCEFLHENQFLVGISVDGTKDIHNKYRHKKDGGNSFNEVLEATKLMDKYRVDYNILTVVTRDVTENIERIYCQYKECNWKYQQYIACLDPIGEPRGQKEYALTPRMYGEFLIQLFQLWYQDFWKKDEPYIRQFDNYIGILMGYQPEACEQRGYCGIQNVVEADGSVYPCDFYMMDEYRLGNFNDMQLNQINDKRKQIEFVEQSQNIAAKCRKCKYYLLCRGGCQRNREWNSKDQFYQNYFCESYQVFFDNCMKLMAEVAKETVKRRG